MLASQSCLLTDVVDQLHEDSKKINIVDRGYDDNKMFLKLDELGQEYVIRLTAKRKLLDYLTAEKECFHIGLLFTCHFFVFLILYPPVQQIA